MRREPEAPSPAEELIGRWLLSLFFRNMDDLTPMTISVVITGLSGLSL